MEQDLGMIVATVLVGVTLLLSAWLLGLVYGIMQQRAKQRREDASVDARMRLRRVCAKCGARSCGNKKRYVPERNQIAITCADCGYVWHVDADSGPGPERCVRCGFTLNNGQHGPEGCTVITEHSPRKLVVVIQAKDYVKGSAERAGIVIAAGGGDPPGGGAP